MSLEPQDFEADESDPSLHAIPSNRTPAETPISEASQVLGTLYVPSADAAEVDSDIASGKSPSPGAETSSSALAPPSELSHGPSHPLRWSASGQVAANDGDVLWPLSDIKEARLLHHFVAEISKFVGLPGELAASLDTDDGRRLGSSTFAIRNDISLLKYLSVLDHVALSTRQFLHWRPGILARSAALIHTHPIIITRNVSRVLFLR